jgi:hypothetical protein
MMKMIGDDGDWNGLRLDWYGELTRIMVIGMGW